MHPMRHFIALIWASVDSSQARVAGTLASKVRASGKEWKTAIDTDGLIVLYTGERDASWNAHRLTEADGVILGKLFRRGRSSSTPVNGELLEASESSAIIASAGRELIDKYWGQYIAFIRDRRRSRTCVLRDPSGGALCLTSNFGGVSVYFSHTADVVALNSKEFSINWNYLLAEFLHTELVSESTGIVEIRQVLAGQCHEINLQSRTTKFYWNPAEVVRSSSLDDIEIAVEELRQTVQDCVDGWASSYRSVLHNLSGGLDSAIVLGALAQAPSRPHIVCLNYRTLAREGDERAYARAAATMWKRELIERELPGYSAEIRLLIEEMPILESPTRGFFGLPGERMQMEIAKDFGVDAFTSGEGGDHLFYRQRAPVIAADYMQNRGIDKEFLNTVLSTARLTNKSFWSVLATAFSSGLFRRPWDSRLANLAMSSTAYIKDEALASVPSDIGAHEWSSDRSGIPAGKQAQIFVLPKVLHRRQSFGRPEVTDVLHPLMAQPILETSLRIPTYLLASGGVDRGLARRAFSDLVPKEILARYSKGATGNFAARIYAENLAFIREFLLGGKLARQAFVERNTLDELLTQRGIENVGNLFPIGKLVATEAWLRRWECYTSGGTR